MIDRQTWLFFLSIIYISCLQFAVCFQYPSNIICIAMIFHYNKYITKIVFKNYIYHSKSNLFRSKLKLSLLTGWHLIAPKPAAAQESENADVAIMGIPCPIFSVLNSRTRGSQYNPFLEQLGSNPWWWPPFAKGNGDRLPGHRINRKRFEIRIQIRIWIKIISD